MKIVIVANTDWYLYNFRLPLIQTLKQQGHHVILLSPSGNYHQYFLSAGLEWISFPFSRQGTNPIFELLTIWRLTQIYRRLQPDLVHHHTIKPVIYGSLSARMAGVPHIINSITGLGHIFIEQSIQVQILRQIAKWLYRFSLKNTQIIFETPDDRAFFLQSSLAKPEQTHLILGTGVNVKKFSPVPRTHQPPVVLFSGRLLITKGLLDFVDAVRILKQKGWAARFVVVGLPDPGNPASIPLPQVKSWEQEGLIEYWGWRDDMPLTMSHAHIFCMPSYREGISSALLEACASGLPVVTTNVPGCREIVQDGFNGFLVPPRDAKALAMAIEKLLSDPNLRQTMGEAGRRLMIEKFSVEQVNTQTLSLYFA